MPIKARVVLRQSILSWSGNRVQSSRKITRTLVHAQSYVCDQISLLCCFSWPCVHSQGESNATGNFFTDGTARLLDSTSLVEKVQMFTLLVSIVPPCCALQRWPALKCAYAQVSWPTTDEVIAWFDSRGLAASNETLTRSVFSTVPCPLRV